jgi:PAS domain-containing protein
VSKRPADEGDHFGEADYRALFEEFPIAVWLEDLSAIKAAADELRAQGVSDMRAHLLEHADEMVRMARLVRVLHVNQRSLELYGAATQADLLSGLSDILNEESLPGLAEQVAAIADGRTLLQVEGINHTLSGERLDVILCWSVSPGHEATCDRVVLSIVDIRPSETQNESFGQARSTSAATSSGR